MTRQGLCAFDLDGTLVDSAADIVFHANVALDALGRAPWSEAQARPLIGRGARALLLDMLGPEVAAATVDHAVAEFAHSYAQQPVRHTVLFDSAVAVLTALRNAGMATAVVTNKLQGITTAVLRALDVETLLDVVVGAGAGLPHKPAPDMLAYAARQTGATPQTTTLVGDSVVDLQAAAAFGCGFVGVGHGVDGGVGLRGAGVVVCAGLGDVCARLLALS